MSVKMKKKQEKTYKEEKLTYFDRQKEQLSQFQAEYDKLKNEYCSLDKKYKELKERYDKIVRQECIISDHCLHCANASVTWNYYRDNCHLITCDIFHSCVHYKRADTKEDEIERDLDKHQ